MHSAVGIPCVEAGEDVNQVVNQGGLPFPVRQAARHASAKKLKQLKRNSQTRDRALVAQGGAVEETFPIRPVLAEGARAVPADRIAIEEFQAKRSPRINSTAQDLKQKHAARHARQQAAKLPKPE
jgi:hypothetical protein